MHFHKNTYAHTRTRAHTQTNTHTHAQTHTHAHTHTRTHAHELKIIVPTPIEGGRNYILNWVFFDQSILADRYIHRRELRLVSLENLSSVEYGIKKMFLVFVFDREISRFKLWKH